MSKIVDKYIVEVIKDGKRKIEFKKGSMVRSSLRVSDKEFKIFNDLSESTCQRYYIDEKLTKELK
ncbi:MAG: hypothetical protein GY870_21915 [archaeon]|nr:hypothetical protein [archaeon]